MNKTKIRGNSPLRPGAIENKFLGYYLKPTRLKE